MIVGVGADWRSFEVILFSILMFIKEMIRKDVIENL